MHMKKLLLTTSIALVLLVLLAACVQTPPLPTPDEDVRSVVRDLNVPGTLRASSLIVNSAVDLPNGSLALTDLAQMPGIYGIIDKTAVFTIPNSTIGPVLYSNEGATAPITYTLPSFFTVGTEYCFFVADAFAVSVSPDVSDTILALTNAAGDVVRNSGTAGGSLCLVAHDEAVWTPVSRFGTWTDVN